MEDTSGFYKYYQDKNYFIFAFSSVTNRSFSLKRENKDQYEYPIDGWYWFNSLIEAENFFKGLGYTLEEESINN